jgi:hypothetical protein
MTRELRFCGASCQDWTVMAGAGQGVTPALSSQNTLREATLGYAECAQSVPTVCPRDR